MTVLATDPPVSEAQRRAMFAAAEGRSTLGIPKKVGEEFVGKAKDEASGLRAALRALLAWVNGEEEEAQDSGRSDPVTGDMALDRDSVRDKDADGRLHVGVSNISKANVCEYYGREIPDYEALGLDPDKKYKLLRDPDELAKAVDTFNNIPLLSEHVPVSADDHRPDLVIGSTGTDAVFEPPYLKNSLVVWAQDAIDEIEGESKKELSCAYRYRADMTPGEYEGENYDGVMRDIVGNHVALVREGRAGPDVVVGDGQPDTEKEVTMTMKDRLAKAKNTIASLRGGKIAQDAEMEDLTKLIDAFAKHEEEEGAEKTADMNLDPNAGVPGVAKPEEGADAEGGKEAVMAFLKDKLGAEDYAKCAEMMNGMGEDEDDEDEESEKKQEAEMADKEAKDKRAKDEEEKPDYVEKKAMDAAISARVAAAVQDERKRQRETREAEKFVRPIIGDLAMAHDSAEGVYRTALTAKGVDIEGVHPSAYRALLEMLPKRQERPAHVAMDAAAQKGFAERFPGAAKITVL